MRSSYKIPPPTKDRSFLGIFTNIFQAKWKIHKMGFNLPRNPHHGCLPYEYQGVNSCNHQRVRLVDAFRVFVNKPF